MKTLQSTENSPSGKCFCKKIAQAYPVEAYGKVTCVFCKREGMRTYKSLIGRLKWIF